MTMRDRRDVEGIDKEEAHRMIRALDVSKMGDLDAGLFLLLREKAAPDDRRRLERLFERFQSEALVRRVVKEELEKAGLGPRERQRRRKAMSLN